MVKNITISIILALGFNACATKSNSNIEGPTVVKYPSEDMSGKKLNKDERSIYYKGGYDINYKEPRTVWFKPLLTEKGNILSERTITLAPKDLKWSNDHYMETGDKFNELVKDKR